MRQLANCKRVLMKRGGRISFIYKSQIRAQNMHLNYLKQKNAISHRIDTNLNQISKAYDNSKVHVNSYEN